MHRSIHHGRARWPHTLFVEDAATRTPFGHDRRRRRRDGSPCTVNWHTPTCMRTIIKQSRAKRSQYGTHPQDPPTATSTCRYSERRTGTLVAQQLANRCFARRLPIGMTQDQQGGFHRSRQTVRSRPWPSANGGTRSPSSTRLHCWQVPGGGNYIHRRRSSAEPMARPDDEVRRRSCCNNGWPVRLGA